MTQYVICALQMEGFHCWPEADGELAYLKNSHRHIFSPSMGMRMALVILGGALVRTSPLKS